MGMLERTKKEQIVQVAQHRLIFCFFAVYYALTNRGKKTQKGDTHASQQKSGTTPSDFERDAARPRKYPRQLFHLS